jgi:hypothetical protein
MPLPDRIEGPSQEDLEALVQMAMDMKTEAPDQTVAVLVGAESVEVTEADTAMEPVEWLQDKGFLE